MTIARELTQSRSGLWGKVSSMINSAAGVLETKEQPTNHTTS